MSGRVHGTVRGAVAAVAMLALVACSSDASRSGAAASGSISGSGTSGSSSGPPAAAASHVDVLGGPDWMAADDTWLYVKVDLAAVARIDPKTATVAGRTEIGGSLCQGLGAGFGSVWACKDTSVVRIDPASDRVVATIPISKFSEQGHLVTGFGRVWVLLEDNHQLVGIDPATNQPDPPIVLPVAASDLAIDAHHLWAVSAVGHTLMRVDPTTKSVDGRIDDLGEIVAVADDGSNVFVATPDHVVQIDAATMAQVATVDSGPGYESGIGASHGDLWIRRKGTLLRRRSGSTELVSVPFEPPVSTVGDVLVAFGSTWSSCNDDNVVVRVDAA